MSRHFLWGFLNFYSGLGLAFLTLVHFQRLLGSLTRSAVGNTVVQPAWWEYVGHVMLVNLLFLWHLAVWGIYGVIMGCQTLWAMWRHDGPRGPVLRRGLLLMGLSLPSLSLLAYYFLGKSGAAAQGINWGSWSLKLQLPLSLLLSYDLVADLIGLALWLIALSLWFGPGWIQFRWSALAFTPWV